MKETKITEIQTSEKTPEQKGRVFSFKATQLVWLVFGILEGLFALRVFMKLIGANPDSPFAGLVYGFTSLFLLPFSGLTGTPAVGNMVLEISTLIAMAVYALFAWALERIIWVTFYRPRE